MAKSTARTGKLKRAKARKEPAATAEPTRDATVGELLAELDGRQADASRLAPPPEDDELGLSGFEDDASQDLPAPPPAEPSEEEPRPDGVDLSDTLPMAPEDDLSRVRGQASPRLMSVVESLLFASDRPLTVRDIRKVLREPTVRQVQLALKRLQVETASRGVVLSQVAGGFRLRTHPANAKWVQKMLASKPARLSRSQLEALAVIAYRQPITKAEIDHVRGVDCGAVLRVLLERDLARIVGRKEEPGRPHLYGTTVEFLEFFNLRSLRDMPDLHEFRELTDESRATLRTEMGEDADELEAEVLGQEVLDFDPEASKSTSEGEGDENASSEDGVESTTSADGEATAAPDGDEGVQDPAEGSASQPDPNGVQGDAAEPAADVEAAEDADTATSAEAADDGEAAEDAEAAKDADAASAGAGADADADADAEVAEDAEAAEDAEVADDADAALSVEAAEDADATEADPESESRDLDDEQNETPEPAGDEPPDGVEGEADVTDEAPVDDGVEP